MRSSAGEHLVHTEGVTGSIPVASTIIFKGLAVRAGWRAGPAARPARANASCERLFVSTGAFVALLGATFAVWFSRERTLSIHSIVTRPRELFYWAAILCTFAPGTAAGDLVAEKLQRGYALSAAISVGMIAAAATACAAMPGDPLAIA